MKGGREIFLSGSAPSLFPADTFFALLYSGDGEQAYEIPKRYPFKGEWGGVLSTCMLENPLHEIPSGLDMVWLSIVEQQFYSCELEFSKDKLEGKWQLKSLDDQTFIFEYIIVGMAPGGGVAVWFGGTKKQIVVEWAHCDKIEVEMEDFVPSNPTMSLSRYCQAYWFFRNLVEKSPR